MQLLSTLFVAAAAHATFFVPMRHKISAGTAAAPSSPASNPIAYIPGKKVLTDDVNLYMIYYGNWSTPQVFLLSLAHTFPTQIDLVNEFANGLGSSSWYASTKEYYYLAEGSSKKVYVNGALKVGKTIIDEGSLGDSLSGSNLADLIQTNVDNGKLPEDENGIYFIMTGNNIDESIRPDLGAASFCSDYCGYHISTKLSSGKQIQYGFVGNPITKCAFNCLPQQNQRKSPNNDPGVDGLLSALAHEITEAISDPISDIDDARAWQDSNGSENGDKCAYDFGSSVKKDQNGASYNLEFGGKKYLIQQNWSPVSQSCVQI